MSILLRPKLPLERSLLLTTAAAVSVAEACEALSGRRADIKWVNDVYMDGKKVCGILTESALAQGSPYPEFSVVGIGVNVLPPPDGFPEDIADIADSVFRTGDPSLIPALASEILTRFGRLYADLTASPDALPSFLPAYRSRMLGLGASVTVLRGDETFPAILEAMDDDFRLILRREDGSRVVQSSGEIRIRV